jgi:pimeloyl-ACP methyl ester carboxylesterase
MPGHLRKKRGFPVALAAAGLLAAIACAPRLESRPDLFEVTKRETHFGKATLHASYVTPAGPPSHAGVMLAFFTGDAGWLGTSGLLFEHLAAHGYTLVGFNSREILKPIKQSGERISMARSAETMRAAFDEARRKLGLPETTPLIVVGFSRGASAAALTAVHSRLRDHLAGAVAIALTRESDHLRAPKASERPPGIEVDDKERIQLYPALVAAASVPVAVIQSTNDKYVSAAESRRLLGPDTPTRRLYEVEARNHGFSGGEETLLHDLDDALDWIEHARAGNPPP